MRKTGTAALVILIATAAMLPMEASAQGFSMPTILGGRKPPPPDDPLPPPPFLNRKAPESPQARDPAAKDSQSKASRKGECRTVQRSVTTPDGRKENRNVRVCG